MLLSFIKPKLVCIVSGWELANFINPSGAFICNLLVLFEWDVSPPSPFLGSSYDFINYLYIAHYTAWNKQIKKVFLNNDNWSSDIEI